MRRHRTGILAASLLTTLFALRGIGAAQTSVPISIASCTVLEALQTLADPFPRPFGPYTRQYPTANGVRIVYANNAAQSATQVAFDLNYLGESRHITDRGTFSPGTTINHTFGDFAGNAWLGPRLNRCSVVSVHFADGTAWTAETHE